MAAELSPSPHHLARVDGSTTDQRRLVRPRVLRCPGRRVEQVPGTEWLDRPQEVVDRPARGMLQPVEAT